ncbi:MAG: V-type ATPase 116kDa subunit family protein [Bacteroidales bacterium]|nr:V-type ATPase 116kDa subunit family protein [Bacteroidales bacterium]
MKKLTFLIYHKDYESFLDRIRELGVIHIQERQAGEMNDDLQHSLSKHNQYKDMLKEMSFQFKDKADEQVYTDMSASDLIEKYNDLVARLQSLNQRIPAVDKEIAEMNVWGEFSWKDIHKLQEAGYCFQFYNCTEREYQKDWENLCDIVQITKAAGHVFFVTISKEPVTLDVEPVSMPSLSLSELQQKKETLVEEQTSTKAELQDFCRKYSKTLEHYDQYLQGDIDLIKVRLDGEPQAEGAVLLMEGWIPVNCEEEVRKTLDESSVYYEIRDAVKGDNPPIKLKNNWFNKLYEVLTGMYGMPEYTEFDPTPLIAPFFSLFFAFCVGDAGYGLMLVLLGLFLKKKMPSMRGMMNLVISLGIFTMIVGAILGTCFGVSLIDQSWIPENVKQFMIAGKIPGTNFDKQMVLALIIGVIHISVALTIKAIVATIRFGFKNCLSEWGWLIVVVGFVITGTLMFLNLIPENVSTWAFIIIGGVGAIGIYLLNDLHRNVFMNIGAGLWGTYNMASGLMGDTLSYMRLYALGLAGGMLGGVFNQLATMSGDAVGGVIGWIVCGLILVFGHTLNIAMSCLSAFVHPLRLNFVEYFKNAGYEGTGVTYNPFTTVENKNK